MTLGQMFKKYTQMAQTSEYVDVLTVVNDLYQMKQHQQLLKIPKADR